MIKYCIYTDGSFGDDGITHGGIVFVNANTGEVSSKMHLVTSLPQFVSMRNVGGEIMASWGAIFSVVQGTLTNKDKSVDEEVVIDLYYDYEGVGKWITGKWKARKAATIWYRDSVKALMDKLPNAKLNLHWVRGHVGNRFNEVADGVASYVNYKSNGNVIIDMDDIIRDNMK